MAATRLSGLISGMDTESMIAQLVEGRKTKVTNKKKEQIALQYKQDKWKELNTKLKSLQSKFVSNLRYSSSYAKKTSSVSNTSAASVITGENAVDGVQTLKVDQLAKTGYLTGGRIGQGDGNYTALTKMSELGFEGTGRIAVYTGGNEVSMEITGDTTISDVLNKFKEAGLNANFDAKNQRFFVSSKESGEKNDFSITASNADGDNVLQTLGLKVSLTSDETHEGDEAALKRYEALSKYYVADDVVATKANMQTLIDNEIARQLKDYKEQYDTLNKSKSEAEEAQNKLKDKYNGSQPVFSEDDRSRLAAIEEELKNKELSEEDKKKLVEEQNALTEKKTDVEAYEAKQKVINDANEKLAKIAESYNAPTEDNIDGSLKSTVEDKIASQYVEQAKYAAYMYANKDSAVNTGATKVNAKDAIINLNGAEFTNTSNVFEINGLTITALNQTKEGEDVTITTQNDVSGIYDMVKNFLKEYNSVINEIDKLYNADSIGSMKPMTSEEKEAVSESEAEDWEKKLRDSSLRRDSNLSSISDALKSAMSASFTINGKEMWLSDFGINTLGYFEAADNEKNMFHIDGDPDDESTSGKADKLKSMISSDPSTVISFFTQLGQKLYSNMSNISKSVDGYRSFGNFYDDKKMKTDYDGYNTKIAELEEKLNDYEDKWYAKFAKMESAMAKMQSNTSAVSALLGGS